LGETGNLDAEGHYLRGVQLRSSGDASGAEKELGAAVTGAPGYGKYVKALVLLYIDEERYPVAIQVLRQYVNLCGVTALGYALEAELLFKQKHFDAAQLAVLDSLQLSPTDPRMHELLGIIYITIKQNTAASLELKKAAELDPGNPQIRFYFGRSLYAIARYADARDQFLACLKIQPDYRKAHENLGLCYEALREPAKAAEAYQKAIAIETAQNGKKHGEPFGFYGAMLIQAGEADRALEVLRQGAMLSPNSFVVNFEMGHALLMLGRLEESEHYLLAAERLAPEYPRTYFLIAKVYQRQHRMREAAEEYEKFKELNKGGEPAGFPVTDR
jgi:tetratricopeptide (TPR) repeat protein